MRTKDMVGLPPSRVKQIMEWCILRKQVDRIVPAGLKDWEVPKAPSALFGALPDVGNDDLPQPVLLKAPPGCAKSMLVHTFGSDHGYEVRDTRAYHYNPVDWKGVPAADLARGVTRFLPPDFLPLEMLTAASGDPVLWFFDEFDKAPPAVQAPLLEVILDRRVCGRKVRDNVAFVAAANRAEDRAGSFDVSAAIKNRFLILNLRVDVQEWLDWAFSVNVVPEVISFIKTKGEEILFHFEHGGHPDGFPTPRSWAAVSRMVALGVAPVEVNKDVFGGLVGEGASAEFVTHCVLHKEFLNAEDIIVKGDLTRKPPDGPDRMFAFSSALVSAAARAPKEKALEYGRRLLAYICGARFPKEFAVATYHNYARTPARKALGYALTATDEFGVFTDKFEFIIKKK